MKTTRKVIESGVLTTAFAIASAATAISVNAADASTLTANSQIKERLVQENAGTNTKEIAAQIKTKSHTEEDSEWNNKLLADVGKDTYLNVRAKATTKSEVVGKLYRGAGATIKKKGKKWTKIKSGDVVGYVKNEYCVFEEEAQKLAEKVCKTQVTAMEEGLRVRKESNTDSAVITVLDKGESLKVNTSDDTADGWVSVKYNGKKAFVSSDYVKVGLKIEKAVSVEEDEKETVSAGTSVSSDELRLLAAIIECEAGGEPYAGQLAVGAVVMNRVQSGSFPDSISGVVYQKGQFTPAASGKLSRVLSSGKIGDSCYKAAKEALKGVDNTGGCKFFHAGTRGKGTVIGSQIFY